LFLSPLISITIDLLVAVAAFVVPDGTTHSSTGEEDTDNATSHNETNLSAGKSAALIILFAEHLIDGVDIAGCCLTQVGGAGGKIDLSAVITRTSDVDVDFVAVEFEDQLLSGERSESQIAIQLRRSVSAVHNVSQQNVLEVRGIALGKDAPVLEFIEGSVGGGKDGDRGGGKIGEETSPVEGLDESGITKTHQEINVGDVEVTRYQHGIDDVGNTVAGENVGDGDGGLVDLDDGLVIFLSVADDDIIARKHLVGTISQVAQGVVENVLAVDVVEQHVSKGIVGGLAGVGGQVTQDGGGEGREGIVGGGKDGQVASTAEGTRETGKHNSRIEGGEEGSGSGDGSNAAGKGDGTVEEVDDTVGYIASTDVGLGDLDATNKYVAILVDGDLQQLGLVIQGTLVDGESPQKLAVLQGSGGVVALNDGVVQTGNGGILVNGGRNKDSVLSVHHAQQGEQAGVLEGRDVCLKSSVTNQSISNSETELSRDEDLIDNISSSVASKHIGNLNLGGIDSVLTRTINTHSDGCGSKSGHIGGRVGGKIGQIVNASANMVRQQCNQQSVRVGSVLVGQEIDEVRGEFGESVICGSEGSERIA